MRAYGRWFSVGLLLGMVWVGSGCKTVNNCGCKVEDGGCCMRYGPTSDHWGDDELSFSGDDKPNRENVFTEESMIQGNDYLSMVQGTATLPAGTMWPNVNSIAGAKTLVDISFKDTRPRIITVTLGVLGILPTLGGAGIPYAEVVGIMEIGIGGLLFNAEVDFVAGTQFSLSASKFKLSAIYCTMYGDVTAIPAIVPTVQVGASVSLGVVAHGQSPQRTLTRYNWVPGTPIGEHWFVPHFAKNMQVSIRPRAGAVLSTYFINSGGLDGTDYATAAPLSPHLPIPNDASMIGVADIGVATTIMYSLIFDLAL